MFISSNIKLFPDTFKGILYEISFWNLTDPFIKLNEIKVQLKLNSSYTTLVEMDVPSVREYFTISLFCVPQCNGFLHLLVICFCMCGSSLSHQKTRLYIIYPHSPRRNS